MDALDPQDGIPFADVLYNNDVFTQALYQALSDNGVIVMQLGVTPDLEDITDIYTKSKNRAKLTYGLESAGFESMHAYEEVNRNHFLSWLDVFWCCLLW
jgi:spermidine synthase